MGLVNVYVLRKLSNVPVWELLGIPSSYHDVTDAPGAIMIRIMAMIGIEASRHINYDFTHFGFI